MSLDATIWAWRADVKTSPQRVVLLSLADRAGESHRCYPSVTRLVEDTKLNRKTVMKVLDDLELMRLIKDTGEFRGNGVKVYQLLGVSGREDNQTNGSSGPENGTSAKNGTSSFSGTGSKNGTSPKNGTATSPKNGTETSTENGTQNLPIESPNESKNKKTWICFKKLGDEFRSADDSIDFHSITISNWFEREKRAFEIYNAGKDLCVDLLNFYFADWLINAYRTKYSESAKQTGQKFSNQSAPKANRLSDKQISVFATKLAHHPEFAGRYGEPGESYEKLAAKIAVKLQNPAQAKKWEQYLKQVGFTGQLEDVA